ncbi:MAG: PQQ-binding-like beta-propeller repeat protein, partial [Planctomycetaceae bacterium]
YASAIIVEVDGLKQYVQFLGKGLVGVDAETGKFLWRYDRTAEGSPANIPTPLAHEGYVYSATGRGGAALVEIQVNGKDVETQEVYFSTRLPEGIGGAVRIGDDLYGSNDQGMICADFTTGDIKWQDRAIGPCSVCYADGCLYLHSERSGEVALIEAAPEAYREKGRFTPPDPPKLGTGRGQPRSWAYPVVANGRLYIRNWNRLWCYDIQE